MARVTDRLHLVFFGGEPMTRWRSLAAMTEAAKAMASQTGVRVNPTVTTNGTLLNPKRAAWLAEQGFVVAISCDGIQDAHDANRVDAHGGGSYGETVQGLRAAIDAGVQVRCILVVDPANVAMLDRSIAHLTSLGVADLVLNPNWSADWNSPALREAWSLAYGRVSALYVDSYRAGKPFWLSTIDAKIAAHLKGGYLPSDRCDLGRKNLVVAPGGNLYPCDRLVGDDTDPRFVIGHVSTGPDALRVRAITGKSDLLPAECLPCAVAKRCRNRCVCANVAMTGEVDAPSELLCFHEQLSIRTADDAARQLIDEANALFVRRHYGSGLQSG